MRNEGVGIALDEKATAAYVLLLLGDFNARVGNSGDDNLCLQQCIHTGQLAFPRSSYPWALRAQEYRYHLMMDGFKVQGSRWGGGGGGGAGEQSNGARLIRYHPCRGVTGAPPHPQGGRGHPDSSSQ